MVDVTDEPTVKIQSWRPWQKIDLTINAETVSPVYAFNKLFVFWVEQTTEKQTTGIDPSKKKIVTKATINYSFHNVSGKWIQPQTLLKDAVIYDSSATDWKKDSRPEQFFWKKACALNMPAKGSEPEKILVLFGDHSEDQDLGLPFRPRIQAELNSELIVERDFLNFQPGEATAVGFCYPFIFALAASETQPVRNNYYGDMQANNPVMGVVGYWPLNGDAKDVVGHNDGLRKGTAKFEQADDFPLGSRKVLALDGTEGYVEVPHSDSIDFVEANQDFTVEVWAKSDGPTIRGAILSKEDWFRLGGSGYFIGYY